MRHVGPDVGEVTGLQHRMLLEPVAPPEADSAEGDEAGALDAPVEMASGANTRSQLGARQAKPLNACRGPGDAGRIGQALRSLLRLPAAHDLTSTVHSN